MAEKNPTGSRKTRVAKPLAAEMGKVPPQAIELEEAVLGAIMVEKDAVVIVSEILKPECFYKETHQEIFKAYRIYHPGWSPSTCLRLPRSLGGRTSWRRLEEPLFWHNLPPRWGQQPIWNTMLRLLPKSLFSAS